MIDTNELRRLAQGATPGPWRVYEVGVGFEIAAGDNVIAQAQSIPNDTIYHTGRKANAKFIAAANPAAITELLDLLEAAESEAVEQARLNGMGAERELALMAKLEATEKERDFAKTEVARLHDDIRELTDVRVLDKEDLELVAHLQGEAKAKLDRLEAAEKERDELRAKLEAAEKSDAESIAMYRKARDERDALRALVDVLRSEISALRTKIEQMEQQEPVVTLHDDGYFTWVASRPYESDFAGWRMKVYARPGAKGEYK